MTARSSKRMRRSSRAAPAPARDQASSGGPRAGSGERRIGFGNVVKILLRFTTRWWTDCAGRDLADLSVSIFRCSGSDLVDSVSGKHPVPDGLVLRPKADTVAQLTASELVEMGLAIACRDFRSDHGSNEEGSRRSQAINWGNDPFARGAIAMPHPNQGSAVGAAQTGWRRPCSFPAKRSYAGPDMGTVEAALASDGGTAQALLAGG